MTIRHRATAGRVYYLNQHVQLDSTHYLLRAVMMREDNKETNRFQNYNEAGRESDQSVTAEVGDELVLERIDLGRKFSIDSGVDDIDPTIRERLEKGENLYVNLDEDAPYRLDLLTVSNDRKGKLFKIIGFGDTDADYCDYPDQAYTYICILNVKPQ